MSSGFPKLSLWAFGSFISIIGIWGLAVVPQSPLLGPFLILSEAFRSFPVLMLAVEVSALAAAALWWRKHPRVVVVFVLIVGIASALYVARLWPFIVAPTRQAATEGKTMTIAVVNVEFGGASVPRLRSVLLQKLPDILVVSEVTPGWLTQAEFLSEYPFKVEMPGKSAEGTALFSQLPVHDIQELAQGFFRTFALTVNVKENTPVHLIALHAPPPHGDPAFRLRKKYFDALGTYLSSLPSAATVVLAGDFNTTPLSDAYRTFVSQHNLLNAAHGRGLPGTWPLKIVPSVGAYIDQVLYRGNAEGVGLELLDNFGSDHRPLLVTLRFY